MAHRLLQLGPRITVLPIIHGSGDCALEVRRIMLAQHFDCVAVPLPPSFQTDVEAAIEHLPAPTLVVQPETPWYRTDWRPRQEGEDEEEEEDERSMSYVPIDPCQGVIAALRVAAGEHLAREFIDLETVQFQPFSDVLPDPYALKQVSLERFAAAILPSIQRPPPGQPRDRIRHMACQLRRLEQEYDSTLFVCSVLEWPWIREAFSERLRSEAAHQSVEPTAVFRADPQTLLFVLGELPFITGLYERARARLEDDDNLSVDGVKELLVAARDAYRADLKKRARRITPQTLSVLLKYIRNLCLVNRRMTPDLYDIVVASQQIAGDQFALHVAETARSYACEEPAEDLETIKTGIDQGQLPNGDVVNLISRLPGPPVCWRTCQLQRRPAPEEHHRWQTRWNPFAQCSYPPEDTRIENFRSHLFDRARAVMGADLVRTEKFTTSIKDGIDIRDTLRHWYAGEIYVKVLPPSRGNLDCAVMLFDSPADPREYPWRTTWFAEHEEESTLAFFATDFRKELVGPGIGLATYGGAMFLYPPRPVPDIWTDRRLDFTETMEERLLASACLHSECPQIALLSPLPPGPGWRQLARRFRRTFVHMPLAQFGEQALQQLRMVHVLNGRQVRSYADFFIRRA